MNDKSSKAKPKMVDVMKPKKTTSTDADAASLVIQSRPMIGLVTSIGSPSDDQTTQDDSVSPANPPSAPVLPSQSKRTLIVPISDSGDKETTPANNPAATETAQTAPKVEPLTQSPKEDDPADTPKDDTATITSDSEAEIPKPSEESQEKAADKPNADEADPEDDEPANKGEKPNPETEKAIAEAAAAAKREREVEDLIDSKHFYVPINAVARKREVKHSAFMTVIVLLLAIVLIDLMLDSGLIFLAEKIPHTHFFTTTSIDQ